MGRGRGFRVARPFFRICGERRRRRALAAGLLGVATVAVYMGAIPAGASPAPKAWDPVARDLRHADQWVLTGERDSRMIAATHARVLFVGDSITQWWQRYGTAAWQEYFSPLGAADDGVAGDTTSNVLARIEDGSLRGLDPRVVVLMVGTNNIALHQSPPGIARGVMSVVAALRARLPSARLLLLGVLPRGRPGSADRRAVEAIDGLLASGAPAAGAAYLDVGKGLVGAGGRFLPGAMHADLLHPAAGGYGRMAALLAPQVRQLMGAAPA